MFWAKVVVCSVATAVAMHGQELAPEVLLLARIKLKMADNLGRLPNYTCVQTTERFRRSGAAGKLEAVDTLRLEVAYIGGKELFAWPGANNFEERELSGLARGGAIGNGAFALNARGVFLSHAATFQFAGEARENARRVATFTFSVPQMFSGYGIRVASHEAVVGYHGAFTADAETLDLLRLDVIADDVPPPLQLLSASERIEYERTPIGDSNFLLPRSSELTMIDYAGRESRNRSRFTGCRQYAGESSVSFADPPPDERSASPQTPDEVALPAGIRLEVALRAEVDLRSAAVGDPVSALSVRAVKQRGTVIVPEGAVLSGRIARLERQHPDYYAVALTFTAIEFDNKRAGIAAALDGIGPFPALADRSRRAPEPEVFTVKRSASRLPAGLRLRLTVHPAGTGAR